MRKRGEWQKAENKIGAIIRPNGLVATCADEGIQHQLSAMRRKQNI